MAPPTRLRDGSKYSTPSPSPSSSTVAGSATASPGGPKGGGEAAAGRRIDAADGRVRFTSGSAAVSGLVVVAGTASDNVSSRGSSKRRRKRLSAGVRHVSLDLRARLDGIPGRNPYGASARDRCLFEHRHRDAVRDSSELGHHRHNSARGRDRTSVTGIIGRRRCLRLRQRLGQRDYLQGRGQRRRRKLQPRPGNCDMELHARHDHALEWSAHRGSARNRRGRQRRPSHGNGERSERDVARSARSSAADRCGNAGWLRFQDLNRDGIFEAGENPRRPAPLPLRRGGTISATPTRRGRLVPVRRSAGRRLPSPVAPASWWAIRGDWVPDTTGSLYAVFNVQLTSTAFADFGWRAIVRSTDPNAPFSSYVGTNGLQVKSYDDVIPAKAIYDRLMSGLLIGPEARFTTIRFDFAPTGSTSTTAHSSRRHLHELRRNLERQLRLVARRR